MRNGGLSGNRTQSIIRLKVVCSAGEPITRIIGADEGTRTPTPFGQEILSLPRLPIPPSGQFGIGSA